MGDIGLGLNILCVEDDADSRELLDFLLTGEGYSVACVDTAEEGLAKLAGSSFHLLITDFNLPDHNGTWLLEQARERKLLDGTEAILITAHPQPELLDRPDGVRAFRKPLDVDDLVLKIHEILAPARESELARARGQLVQSRATPRPPSMPPAEVGVAKGSAAPRAGRAPRVEFVLYVSTASRASLKALRNLSRLLGDYDPCDVRLDVVDLSREFVRSAEEDRIAFTPTLVKRTPAPRIRVLGDLSDTTVVRDLLSDAGVEPVHTK